MYVSLDNINRSTGTGTYGRRIEVEDFSKRSNIHGLWWLKGGYGDSMVAHQTVNLLSRVQFRHLTSLQEHAGEKPAGWAW